jgi:hypothetical protein
MSDKKRSSSLERRVQYYPKPRYEALIDSYAKDLNVSKSSVIGMGVKLFFDTMPAHKREELLRDQKK